MEQQQETPKQTYQAGNYKHWRWHNQKGQWVSIPDPRKGK